MTEIKATYSDWKLIKTRGVIQLVFEIPASADKVAFAALGGMPNHAEERWFILPNIEAAESEVVQHPGSHKAGDNALPASDTEERPARATILITEDEIRRHSGQPPREPPPDTDRLKGERPARAPLTLAQRAGMLCGQTTFHRFLLESHMIAQNHIPGGQRATEDAAIAMRMICGVKSRCDILPGLPSGAAFEELHAKYTVWLRHPEVA